MEEANQVNRDTNGQTNISKNEDEFDEMEPNGGETSKKKRLEDEPTKKKKAKGIKLRKGRVLKERRVNNGTETTAETTIIHESPSVDNDEDGISEIEEISGDEGDYGEETINEESNDEAVLVIQSAEELRIQEDIGRYSELYTALVVDDWEKAEDFIRKNPEALKVIISEQSETVFHLMVQKGAFRLLQKHVRNVPPESLELKDSLGNTALQYAALCGNIEAAKLLVESNRKLLQISNNDDYLPLHGAATTGRMETVKYLLSETLEDLNDSLNPFTGPSGFKLVKLLVETNLYDLALDLLKKWPTLAREDLAQRRTILQLLARKPMGFESGSRMGYWQQLIYHYLPVQEEWIYDFSSATGDTENQRPQNSTTKSSRFRIFLGSWSQKLHIMLRNILVHLSASIQAIYNKKLKHMHAVEILRMMCAGVTWSPEEAIKLPMLTAARLGTHEIVKEIMSACPNSLKFVDEDGNNALMLAISCRHEKVYKLLKQHIKGNDIIGQSENILHLAATLASATEAPGAALQMQRELQWFKEVENYVLPHIHEKLNAFDKTPKEMFTEQHGKLIEKGERWMKDTAQSCTVVVSLIITAVFAAVFTAPGGNDDKGMPNLLHRVAYKVFVISDGFALFSSTTSLLIFLGILTSSYSEEDFLISLPRRLIIGLMTMFFSIATMMVAYGATIYLVLSSPLRWVIIPLGCIPVTLFAKLQFPLLLRIYSSTYAPTISQPIRMM